MDIPNLYIINDTRKGNEFVKKTYSGYLKKDVFDILFKKIDESGVEEVCTWCVEVVLSGYYEDLWEKIILYHSKYININNPYLSYHIFMRLNQFLKISKNDDFKNNFLDLRNSQEVRNHICEMVCILTNSTKMRKPLNLTRINSNDFKPNVFEGKLVAKDYTTSIKILTPNDPKELTIIVNEFSYHLSENHYNINKALYWLSWIIEWEKTNIKKIGYYNCDFRNIRGIDNKYKKDFIWIFWEIILLESLNRNNNNLEKQLRSLMEFYKFKYSASKKRKRIHIFINAIQILSPEFKFNQSMFDKYPIYDKYHIVIQACSNINIIYKEKKKEENLENDIINSRIKQDTTYCITKFSEINLLDNRDPKEPRYKRQKDLKSLEMEKKKLEKKLKEEKKMLKMEQKFNVLNMIDTTILSDKNRIEKPRIKFKESNINIIPDEPKNKTVSIIDQLDKKIKSKGKPIDSKTKEVFITKKEC
uniref:Uncharacterized protein n=1 Tax=Mimiviridae sp. ChoanoV1 TaxID=2596887 RepID=A0A5B8II12_9VIRU|nr:hypothetical protein 2_24 [Mimiviridae sp. ChoanoV1]